MIKTRKWTCPHGYQYTVTISTMPATNRDDPMKRITVTAPQTCEWCSVRLITEKKVSAFA